MNKGGTHIQENELVKIEVLLGEGYSIPKIATKLGRHKSTLYELMKINGIKYGIKRDRFKYDGSINHWYSKKKTIYFDSKTINNKRRLRKSESSSRYSRIKKGSKLESFVIQKIKQYWSPEQISGRWRLECNERLSKDTIYSYIYDNHPELISKYFRRKGKKYQNRRKEKYQLNAGKSIDLRPIIVERRNRIGDWEGDTIVGSRGGNKQVILTNVDRKSGYLLAGKIKDKSGESVLNETIKLFKKIPKYKRKTMTYDNGREFSEASRINYFTGLDVYFAHPYSSWERGTNENTNGLIRQFLPKKTDFQSVSENQLKYFVSLINSRPRKRLNYLSPNEVFFNNTKSRILV